jgi:tetratricopeptide (TPR) repeat protein
MKKKAAAKVKRSAPKQKKAKPVKAEKSRAAAIKPMIRKPAPPPPDPRHVQAVQNYESGLKAMQEHKFERAKGLFEKAINGPSRELADRAAMHLNTCVQHLARNHTSFKSSSEQYDYAVSLMNTGDYAGARTQLERILKNAPKTDYAVYGLAVLECLMGNFEQSLKKLDDSIRMNPGNRFTARNDSDFQDMADDPRFTELLYPEAPEPASLPPPSAPPAKSRRR